VGLRNVTSSVVNTITGGGDGADTVTITSASGAHGLTNLTIPTGATGVDILNLDGNVSIDGSYTLIGLERIVLGASSIIDTEQGNNGNAGSVDFGGAPASGNAAGRDLTITTSTSFGGGVAGSVFLGDLDNLAGSYLNDVSITATAATSGTITLLN